MICLLGSVQYTCNVGLWVANYIYANILSTCLMGVVEGNIRALICLGRGRGRLGMST